MASNAARHGNYAVFVRYFNRGTARRMFKFRVWADRAQVARERARERLGVTVRSCDMIDVAADRVGYYGERGAGSPGGVGLR